MGCSTGTNGGGRGSGTDGGAGGGGGGAFGGGGGEDGDTTEGGGGGGGGSGKVTGTNTSAVDGSDGTAGGAGGAAANNTDPDYSGSSGDGGAGGNAANGTNGNDGLVVIVPSGGGRAERSVGRVGQALFFDGAASSTVGNVASGIKSISFWIKADDTTSRGIMAFNNSARIELDGSGNIATAGFTNAKIYINSVENSALPNTGWHNIVVTDSTGINASNVKFATTSNPFIGKLDEVRFYNEVLSAEEIKRLYKIGGTLTINKSSFTGSLADGLVGFWSFDSPDMAGNVAYDRSGQGNNGTLTNGPVRTMGKVGQALDFDGRGPTVGGYIAVPDNSLWNFGNNDFSITFWAKFDDLSGTSGNTGVRDLIGQSNGGGTEDKWMIGYNFPATNQISLHMNGSTIKNITANWAASTNKWYHIVFTRQSNIWKFYIDKDSISSETYADAVPDSTSTLKIGTDGELWRYHDGQIDDVRIYNRALSAEEIKRLYNIGGTFKINSSAGSGSLENGLVGHWTFDGPDMSGNTAYDKSGQGNNGTLTNGPIRTIGKIGQALEFDGSSSYVGLTSDTGTFSAFTVSLWAKRSGAGVNWPRLFLSTRVNKSITIAEHGTVAGGLLFRLTKSAAYTDMTTSAGALTNNWRLLTFTWDGNTMRIYIDGQATSTPVSFTGPIDSVVAEQLPVIGGETADHEGIGNASWFNGSIDEVRVYNKALSGDEIKRLYEMGR